MPLSAVQYQITLSWNTPENEILKAYESILQQVLNVAESYTKYQKVFGESFATFFPFEAEAGQGISKNNLCRDFYEIGFSTRNDWTVGPVDFNLALTKCNQNLLKLKDALSRVEPLVHQGHNVGWSAVEFVFQVEEKQNIDGCRPTNVSNSVWKLFNLNEETPVALSCEGTHEEYYKIHLLSDKFTAEDIIPVLIDVKEDHKAKIERGYHYLYKWR